MNRQPPDHSDATGYGTEWAGDGTRAQRAPTLRAVRPRRWRRGFRLAAMVLVPLLLLSGLALAALYMRLAHGPISLQFLVPPVERALARELGEGRARIDDVVVRLTPSRGIEFRLSNVRLTDTDGSTMATAPLAALGMSFSALWTGTIAPSKIELIDPKVVLFYTPDGGLSLSFPRQQDETIVAAPPGAHLDPTDPGTKSPAAKAPAPAVIADDLYRIDLARVLADATMRARRGDAASSYLREIGLRNATVIVADRHAQSVWRVPELAIDLEHMARRSVISGKATIVSGRGPWSMLFHAEESDKSQRIDLKVSVRDLVPRALAPALPQLAILDGFDLPLGGDATLELSRRGEVIAATMALEMQRGRVQMPWLGDGTFPIDAGLLRLAYDKERQRIEIAPSTLKSGNSRVTLVGNVTSERAASGEDLWVFDLRAVDGTLSAEEFGVDGIPIEVWHAAGHASKQRRFVQLNEFRIRAGGGEMTLAGLIDAPATGDGANAAFNGQLSPMSVSTLKAFWPRALARGARSWIGEHLVRGEIKGGSLKWLAGRYLNREGQAPAGVDERLSATIEAADVEVRPMQGMPTVLAPRTLVRLEGGAIEVSFPEATANVAPGRALALKGGRFTAVNIFDDRPIGEIAFRATGPLPAALDVLDRPPLGLIRDSGLPLDKLDGKVDATVKLTMPLIDDLQAREVRIDAKAHITDGRAKDVLGKLDVTGATLNVDVGDRSIEASGDLILSGVLAKLSWQRILDAEAAGQQPPLRLTAVLDNSDRNQLGLDVNHIVQGDIPVVVTVDTAARPEPLVHLRADLTNADMVLEALSWQKPPGRSAYIEFDVVPAKTNTELQGFRVVGDNIAIDGTMTIGPDNKLREFNFPTFTLDVVTQLSMRGTRRSDNIVDIKVKGRHYDGRAFFRSMFTVGQLTEQPRPPRSSRSGLDISAEFDTVAGHSDVILRNLRVRASRRGDKLVGLDARGTLDSGKPIAAVMEQSKSGPRRLMADSTDAGQAMRLVGFYPNMQGGRVRLEVNLDGRGAAEKTGTLWVENFRILGDAVVSEVVGSTESSGGGKRKVIREVIDFDHMRVPFSVGHGQFVLEDSYARGALLGGSLRGKVDFKAQRMSLGGTYIPLQGLNNVLGGVPLFGQLLSGPRGEGIFGITFAVQGAMSNPQVIVNPLSLVAPGVFRELFQMTPLDPRVTPREQRATSGPGARSSSTTAPARAPSTGAAQPEILGGWSSQSQPGPNQ